MAQTGNQILKEILGVCVQINKKLDNQKGSPEKEKSEGSLSGLFGKKKANEVKEGTKVIDSVLNSITRFTKSKVNTKKIDRTSQALKGLFTTVLWVGENKKKADQAVDIIDKLGSRLMVIANTSKGITMLMMSVGAAFVALAGGLVLAGKLLGTQGALGAAGAMIGIVVAVTGAITLLGRAAPLIKPGANAAKRMGEAMAYVGGGMVVLAMSVSASGAILGMTGKEAVAYGVMGVIGMIGVMGLAFNIIGQFDKNIKQGALVAGAMALGMAALGWGITSLAASTMAISKITAGSGEVEKKLNKKGQERGQFGQMMANVGPGLGMIGIIMVSSASLFAVLGIPVVAGLVALGAGVAITMGVALNTIAKSVLKLSKASAGLTPDFSANISTMVGGMLSGIVRGLSFGLTGKEVTNAKDLRFDGILKINKGLRLLKRMSKTASLFAKAMTAFAKINQMKVIEGYDNEGKPIFGESVDVAQTSKNLSSSFKTFIMELIDGTHGLSIRQSVALNQMGNALNGRKGILSAVIKFSEVLKTYSKYGPEGMIGYSYVDENGETVNDKVSINTVAQNIVTSFTTFVGELTSKASVFDINGSERRKMKKFGKMLIGRKGLLGPIIEFSKAIDAYSKYGKDGSVPVFDKDGNPIIENGRPKTVPIQDIAGGIAQAFTKFAGSFTSSLGDINNRDMRKAEKKIDSFRGIIKQLNKLSKVTEGLDSTSKAITTLAGSIGELSKSIGDLDKEKLQLVNKLGKETFAAKVGNLGEGIVNSVERLQTKIIERKEVREVREESKTDISNNNKPSEIQTTAPSNKDISSEVSKQLETVLQEINSSLASSMMMAFRNTQFTFDFQGENKGVLEVK